MSQSRDPDDFLGWAPDLGSWETAAPPAADQPPQRPVVPAPAPLKQPEPEWWGRPPVSTRVVPQTPTPPSVRSEGRREPQTLAPTVVAFAVMVVATLWMALRTSLAGEQVSPLGLMVCGTVTVLLGRVLWLRLRR